MIKLVLKGILLYGTALITMLYIGGIDSICDKGYTLIATSIICGLFYACHKVISKEDYDKLTGSYKDTEI